MNLKYTKVIVSNMFFDDMICKNAVKFFSYIYMDIKKENKYIPEKIYFGYGESELYITMQFENAPNVVITLSLNQYDELPVINIDYTINVFTPEMVNKILDFPNTIKHLYYYSREEKLKHTQEYQEFIKTFDYRKMYSSRILERNGNLVKATYTFTELGE